MQRTFPNLLNHVAQGSLHCYAQGFLQPSKDKIRLDGILSELESLMYH